MIILSFFDGPRITFIKGITDGPDKEMLATSFIFRRELTFTVDDPIEPSKNVIIEEMSHGDDQGNSFVFQGVFTDSGIKFGGFYYFEDGSRGGHLAW